jgi:hypothetical protein
LPVASISPPFGQLRSVVASLCLLAQLLGLVHLVLVQHARCLEHDALVHSEPAQPAGDRGQAPQPRSTRTIDRRTPGSAAHADDHCLAVGFRRLDLANLGTEAGLATAPARAIAPQPCPGRLAPPAPVALLHLAPKSSPPSPSAV